MSTSVDQLRSVTAASPTTLTGPFSSEYTGLTLDDIRSRGAPARGAPHDKTGQYARRKQGRRGGRAPLPSCRTGPRILYEHVYALVRLGRETALPAGIRFMQPPQQQGTRSVAGRDRTRFGGGANRRTTSFPSDEAQARRGGAPQVKAQSGDGSTSSSARTGRRLSRLTVAGGGPDATTARPAIAKTRNARPARPGTPLPDPTAHLAASTVAQIAPHRRSVRSGTHHTRASSRPGGERYGHLSEQDRGANALRRQRHDFPPPPFFFPFFDRPPGEISFKVWYGTPPSPLLFFFSPPPPPPPPRGRLAWAYPTDGTIEGRW